MNENDFIRKVNDVKRISPVKQNDLLWHIVNKIISI